MGVGKLVVMATTLTNPFGRPSSNRNKATSPAPQWTPSKKHMTAGLVTFVTVFLISTAAALTWNSQGTRGESGSYTMKAWSMDHCRSKRDIIWLMVLQIGNSLVRFECVCATRARMHASV